MTDKYIWEMVRRALIMMVKNAGISKRALMMIIKAIEKVYNIE